MSVLLAGLTTTDYYRLPAAPSKSITEFNHLTAVHLHGLKAFHDRASAVVVVDHRPLINFSRCARLLERIDELCRYRASPDLERHRSSSALAWVRRELENTPSSISRELFEARVTELAERERRMRDTRELELRSLGFGAPLRQGTSNSSVRSPPGRTASLGKI
ncbi:hypothetical protein B0F90DRAFT_1816201 [Multifurca ochricompacta]|uniref:Uncharacterized protein n=1 Tax=Multifurca ochricompacta TaxID=376703 RepID=A0AAD4M5Q6_9AGAM|nr:hypothetical protein B0F90DRAFT_1816201 [Multifurca ochricompacta]